MKEIKTSYQARQSIKNGIDKLANLVKETLGPKGRNVIISRNYSNPVITNDGVTIAKQVQLEDQFENLGAEICKQVSEKTNSEAGDGTTTATILAQAIVDQGNSKIEKGVNAIFLQRALQKYGTVCVKYLKEISKQISNQSQIQSVATISANNDKEIGEIISMAIKQSGIDGLINIEDSNTLETWLERVEGMQVQNGYISPYYVNDTVKMQVEMQDVYILVYNGKIFNPKDLINLLNGVVTNSSSILIFCEDLQGQALATTIVNKTKGTVNVCAVKLPGLGQGRKNIGEDIATVTGGGYFSKELNTKLGELKLDDLGFAKKVIITRDSTTIRQGDGSKEKIDERIQMLKYRAENSASQQEKERYLKRISKIIGGVSVIHIGAQTEMQLREKKYRMEDALNATKSAIQEGILPGSGVGLLRCIKHLKQNVSPSTNEESIAIQILTKALSYPSKQVLKNCGLEEKHINRIVQSVMYADSSIGYNAVKMQTEDLMESGVIDPVKVVRCALQNAISISGLFLTTQGIILQKKDNKQSQQQYEYYNNFNRM